MREFWDSQMKFSAILPRFDDALARMARASSDWAEGRAFSRAAHGDDPRQWVEWTEGTGKSDLLPVVIHGGYWRALRAEDHRFMLAGFAPFGAHLANVEYRLMPDVRLTDVVADAVAGLTLIAERHPDAHLVIIGHSAGAHLAISALAEPRIAARCRGVIALSGVYDLAPVPQSFLQDEINLTPEEVRQHTLPPSDARPPVLYVNGSAETHEYQRGGAIMASQGRAAWHVIDGADHMSLTWMATDAAADLMARLTRL